jgi:hypothetical protein
VEVVAIALEIAYKPLGDTARAQLKEMKVGQAKP